MLGAVLEDNSLMRGPLSVLSVSDLVGSRDQAIYALMLELSEDGEPFDPVVLAQMLEERGQLDRIGGGEYLGSLVDGAMPDPGLVKRHVETIRRLSQLRRLLSVAETLGREINSLGADPVQLLQRCTDAFQLLRSGHDLHGDLLPFGPGDVSRRPEILTLSRVEALEVDWLWPPYLANRMLAMLSGDPSVGKTYLTLAIASAVTLGRQPYTSLPRNPADVLYLSVENSPEHVVRPRFDSFGGDASRFHILRGTVTGEDQSAVHGPVKLSDVGLLSDALAQTKAGLVIVDPIQSYLGADVDAHRSNETRPVLDGLAQLAEEHKCCILLVRHLSKAQTGRAIHRGLGSIDLTGAVRTELFAGSSPDGQRALVQVKSNLGQFGPALGYTIEGDGSFRWTGESELTAAALLAPKQPSRTGAPRKKPWTSCGVF